MDGMKTAAEIVFPCYETGAAAMVRLERHSSRMHSKAGCTPPGSSATARSGR